VTTEQESRLPGNGRPAVQTPQSPQPTVGDLPLAAADPETGARPAIIPPDDAVTDEEVDLREELFGQRGQW
jgi:hypothetical protein